jgi:hypothetical protein
MLDNRTQAFYLRPQVIVAGGKQVDKKGVPPVACIVYAWNDAGIVARGVAICAAEDNWNRKDGCGLAMARARKALGTKKSSLPIGVAVTDETVRLSGLEFLSLWGIRFGGDDPARPLWKSAYAPVLNDFEKKLVQTAKDRVAGIRTPNEPQVAAPVVG